MQSGTFDSSAPSSDIDPYARQNGAGGSSSASSASSGRDGLPRSLGPNAKAQLTEKEAQALRDIKKTAGRFKAAGYLLGALGTAAVVRRRAPNTPVVRQWLYASFGSMLGGFIMGPAGIIAGQRHLANVEDVKHLAGVLEGNYREKRGGAGSSAPGRGIDSQQGSPSGSGGSPATGGSGFEAGGSSWRQGTDINGDTDRPADSYYSSPRPGQQGGSIASASGSGSQRGGGAETATGAQQSSSRWAQIRGERSVKESRWEQLRQENVRGGPATTPSPDAALPSAASTPYSYSTSSSPRQPSSSFGSTRDAQAPPLADPTFGKGTAQDRNRDRQQFEAMMERERKGIDGVSSWGSR